MDKISSKHLIFLIMGLGIVSLKTYPTIILKTGGRESWAAMIIASFIIFLFAWYIFRICRDSNCFDIKKIYFESLGRTLGGVLLALLLITLYLVLIESCSMEANSMHTNMLLSTPTWFFIILFIFPALYTIRKGKLAILVICMIGMILATIAGINLGIMTARYKHLKYLFPIFVYGITPDFIYSILKIIGMYSFIIAAIPFAGDVEKKDKLVRDVLIGMFIVVQMEIVSMMGIISTFNIDKATILSFPKLTQTQEVSYFGFLESGEFFVMLQINTGWYVKYILIFFVILQLLKALKMVNKYTPFFITALVLPPAIYISKDVFMLFKIANYFTYICLGNLFVIPLIVFTVFKLRNKKGASESPE